VLQDLTTLLGEYDYLGALWMTVQLAFWGAVGSLLVGTVVAICRVSPVGVLQKFGAGFVTGFRNTPLTLIVAFCSLGLLNVMQIQLADPGSPTSIVDNGFRWGVVALSVYHAAFVAEAIRSGINTVPPGQAEAARSIGLSFAPTLRHVILPQALRGAIAPLGNTMIALTKNTTVVATVGVNELSYVMRGMIEFNSSLLILIFLLMATSFVVLTLPMGLLFTWLSNRLAVQR
jgi:glutamate transport system permease protein